MVLGEGWQAGRAARARACRSTTTCSSSRSPRTAPICCRCAGVARDVHAIFGIELDAARRHGAPGARDRLTGAGSRSRSRTRISARASWRASSRTSRSAPRRCGSRPACRRPACARSRTSSTSPTTSCTTSAARCTPTTTRAPRRAAHRAPRASRRDAAHARRAGARAGPSMLVIADAEGPQAVGGIMGGGESEIERETTHGRARGRELHPQPGAAHVADARPAHRRLEPLGEGRRSAPRAAASRAAARLRRRALRRRT